MKLEPYENIITGVFLCCIGLFMYFKGLTIAGPLVFLIGLFRF